MHSFHHSRARIFFDIFCALTIGFSCAIAWLQTGASAFLAIAGVAAAYSLVRPTDAGRGSVRVAPAGPVLEPAPEEQGDLLAYVPTEPVPMAAEEAPKAPKAKRRSRKKQPEPEMTAEARLAEPEEMTAVDDEPVAAEPEEEEIHAVVTPLFEPQPLVRQQRTVFGRKAG